HWNWKEGEDVDVWAYFNNADEVELFLNGESLGTRIPEGDAYHVMWRIPFTPGTLEAVSRKGGKEVKRTSISTASEPYALRLTPDRSEINADGTDLSYVAVEVVDKDGNLCPWAENEIFFSVEGSGFNAGTDNGSPISLEPFKSDRKKSFYGRALVIVQNDGDAGEIRVKATSPGLKESTVVINSK
ncbi:MAG: DUF4982 domain-containing protein, partial [Muribaculaceae bacterium]|nr:DUF4982 domain-containing protein [Muribaculaceae bacterium]